MCEHHRQLGVKETVDLQGSEAASALTIREGVIKALQDLLPEASGDDKILSKLTERLEAITRDAITGKPDEAPKKEPEEKPTGEIAYKPWLK